MPLKWFCVTFDSADPSALARFWAEVMGWQVVFQDEDGDEVAIARDETSFPGMVFVRVPEAKAGKNRVHVDLNPDDRDAEVERLLGLGATRADIGQGSDVPWVVMADPEGNEFCVLRHHPEQP
ncbi:MAG TPA: VOC family protein [Acidimicrobiales bacterium]|jgi:predicted enzyme related to lactoylglutathione lyase